MLTQADTTIFPMYADLRTKSFMMAAELAQAHRLLVSQLLSDLKFPTSENRVVLMCCSVCTYRGMCSK